MSRFTDAIESLAGLSCPSFKQRTYLSLCYGTCKLDQVIGYPYAHGGGFPRGGNRVQEWLYKKAGYRESSSPYAFNLTANKLTYQTSTHPPSPINRENCVWFGFLYSARIYRVYLNWTINKQSTPTKLRNSQFCAIISRTHSFVLCHFSTTHTLHTAIHSFILNSVITLGYR